jgi:RNA polymerase sigma factor (sigma-70 family)
LLVLAACSGDSHAFVELSKPHSTRILLTLYRITKNWQDAEDALQEALMKAFLHLDSFQGKASFSTWFTSIAVNTALMLLRKRRGVLEIAIDNAGEVGTYSEWDLKDSRDNPEQSFERQQRAELIQSGILQLPTGLRKVVELQLKGSFKQGDRTMPGHFAGDYEVEALTCENSVTCVRSTRGRQIVYPRRACVGKTASVSKK